MSRYYDDELYHHGIKGMKWGIRRFQNADGSYTSAGKNKRQKESPAVSNEKKGLSDKQKKAIKIGAAAVATGLAIYGGYKVNQYINKQNLLLSKHIGTEFGTRFTDDIKPKVRIGPTPAIRNLNYVTGNNFAAKAGGLVDKDVSENYYNSTRGLKRIKGVLDARAVHKGKKTAFDIANYDDEIKKVMKQHNVMTKGQSQLAKTVRDTINRGGHYKKEWRYWR